MSAKLHSLHPTRKGRDSIRFELRCTTCGYDVIVRIAPEKCPMCSGSVWEHSRRLSAA